ncbi:kinase-like domain-containing protein [Xylariaceae sp. AK1471]|nr:kinase-like domain-containing protein [Xylariaceae sp. AK1471]
MDTTEAEKASDTNLAKQDKESDFESESIGNEAFIADSEPQSPDYSLIYNRDNIENIHDYIPGGYHPTHLGDLLDGRFEVTHKLGYGGHATVWLCSDIEKEQWHAVKIIKASKSTPEPPGHKIMAELRKQEDFDLNLWKQSHIILPLETFWLDGPNGRHLCEVLPLLGPRIIQHKSALPAAYKDPGRLRRICRQIAEAIGFLHQRGICHGDLTAGNILFQIEDISHIGKDEMFDILKESTTIPVKTSSRAAPSYIVVPADLSRLPLTSDVGIVDFGQAFKEGQVPEFLGISRKWAAPEAQFNFQQGLSVDVWSLACIILKLRADKGLFLGDLKTYTMCIETLLGPLPSKYIEACIRHYERALDQKRIHKLPHFYYSLKNTGANDFVVPIKESEFLTVRNERLREETGYHELLYCELAEGQAVGIFKIPDDEVRVLGDLLTRMFKYEPTERPTIKAVLEHEWFEVGPLGLGSNVQSLLETKRREEEVDSAAMGRVPADVGKHDDKASKPLDDDQEKSATIGRKQPTSKQSPNTKDSIQNGIPGTIQSATKPPPTQQRTAISTEIQQSHAEKLFQSIRGRGFHALNNPQSWGTFEISDLILVFVLITAIILVSLLDFLNRRHRLVANVGGPNPPCECSVLVVTSAVRSSTSTYIQGLVGLVEHWTGKLEGVIQCECRVKG